MRWENRTRDSSPSSHDQACPSGMILDWDTSLWSSGPFTEHTQHQHLTDLSFKSFSHFPRVLEGRGADNLTGRNLFLAGRSVYASPSALGRAELRLTALSGPIHFTAANASHLPAPVLNTTRPPERSLCPQMGPRDGCTAVIASTHR